MKVCFLTNNIATRGGQERVLSVIANILAERDNNIEVSILFTSDEKTSMSFAYDLSKRVNVLWDKDITEEKQKLTCAKAVRYLYQKTGISLSTKLMTKLFYSSRGIKKFNHFFSEHQFDIIIGLTPYWAALLTLIETNEKKIGWMHSSYSRYFYTKNESAWNQEEIYNHLLSQLDEVIVLTDQSKEEFSNHLTLQPIRIYNPLTIGEGKEVKRKPNQLLYVGRIDYVIKGLDFLLDIVAKLKERNYTFHLTIVGDGKDFNKLEKEIFERKLDSVVTMVGNQKDVADFYSESAVLLLPSRKEGFGLVAVEAMHNQLPVVSFTTEGPSEVIVNEETGYLVESYDVEEFAQKVAHLLDYPYKQIIMGKKGKERVKDFSTDYIISQWEMLFKNTLEKKES